MDEREPESLGPQNDDSLSVQISDDRCSFDFSKLSYFTNKVKDLPITKPLKAQPVKNNSTSDFDLFSSQTSENSKNHYSQIKMKVFKKLTSERRANRIKDHKVTSGKYSHRVQEPDLEKLMAVHHLSFCLASGADSAFSNDGIPVNLHRSFTESVPEQVLFLSTPRLVDSQGSLRKQIPRVPLENEDTTTSRTPDSDLLDQKFPDFKNSNSSSFHRISPRINNKLFFGGMGNLGFPDSIMESPHKQDLQDSQLYDKFISPIFEDPEISNPDHDTSKLQYQYQSRRDNCGKKITSVNTTFDRDSPGTIFLPNHKNKKGKLSSVNRKRFGSKICDKSRQENSSRLKKRNFMRVQDSTEFEVSKDDRRTTLMIRNIPNKYTQKMLLEEIDTQFKDLYDFFYLPIDFDVNFIHLS